MRNLLLTIFVVSIGAAIFAARADEPQFPERTPDNFREVPPYGPRDGGFNGTGNQGMGDLDLNNRASRGGFGGGAGATSGVNDGFGGGTGTSPTGVGGVSQNPFPNSDSVQTGGAANHQGNGQLGPAPTDTPRPAPVPSSTTPATR